MKISFYDWVNSSFISGILPCVFGGITWLVLHLRNPLTTRVKLDAIFSTSAIVYLAALLILGLDRFKKKNFRPTFEKYIAAFRLKLGTEKEG